MAELLLEVEDLYVEFSTRDGVARAVNGVSFTVERGQTVAILGESGSGKSVTAQADHGDPRHPAGPDRRADRSGCRARELIGLPEDEYRQIRGRQIAMIFQDALSALNPVMQRRRPDLGDVPDPPRAGQARRAKDAAIEVMKRVKIPVRPSASATTRTSSPAGCASAS